jgi:subtilase family serine protease
MKHKKICAWFGALAVIVGAFPFGLVGFVGRAIGFGFAPPPGLFANIGLLERVSMPSKAEASYRFADFQGRPPVHISRAAAAAPQGITPAAIKKAYGLPTTGGSGTIAIIDAYDDANIESDLGVFDKQFGLAACTTKNGCFEKHKVASSTASNSGWALEESLDVEWAHAIAPKAKILLVEAKTESGQNLLDAIDYATARKDVVTVSMSWGGAEFSDELSYDSHFVRNGGVASSSVTDYIFTDAASSTKKATGAIAFFASSGDDGAGASWPASSPYVVGVGGTTLTLATSTGKFIKEMAWSGSGGGVSAYEKEPTYQTTYNIPKANGMRAIPDVSYDADPATGYPVYKSSGSKSGSGSKNGWYTVGGTSAGAPQWAAIQALGLSLGGPSGLAKIYNDKASSGTAKFFRDITSGKNGTCTYYCDARKRYDYVTGLGAPQTTKF